MEAYIVASDGDTPSKIYFDLMTAMVDSPQYLDSFDLDGTKVQGYKLVEEGVYTTDF